jgi:hypothetical protein
MTRRVLVVFVATLVGWLLVSASPASAAPAQAVDYGGVCAITVTPPNPRAGGTAVVHGTQFPPNTSQPIILDGTTQIGTADINPAGIFNTPVRIPADAGAGTHTISVFCATTGVSSTSNFTIPSTTPISNNGNGNGTGHGGSGTTAKTGSDSEAKVVLGLAAIAVGAGLVMAGRRRRRRFAPVT